MVPKIFILIGVYYLYINSGNALLSAIVWGVAMLVVGLLFNGASLAVLLWSAIGFLIAMGLFSLLDWLEGGPFYWIAFITGIPFLLFL